jgi:hypothetical protein
MKILNILVLVCLTNLLFSACSSSVDTDNKLAENKKVTLENLNSVINVSEESQNISNQEELQQEVTIEDLPDGNYKFCSKPASVENITGFDGEAWCFEFNKFNTNIVGTYSFQAPKDTSQICIEGVVESDQVNGIGYERIEYGETKPDIEKEKSRISQNTLYVSKEGYWDNPQKGDQIGNNLKTITPHFYKFHEPEKPGNGYAIWIRYDIVQLDLNKFEQRKFASRYKLYKPHDNCIY